MATLEPQRVAELVAEKIAHPHAAKHFLNALRAMINVAIVAGLRADDPTAGIRIKARQSSGFRTWTDAEITQFQAAHPIGTRARLAFGLLLYSGQRRGDVIRMGRQHVRDGFMRVDQQRTGIALEIPLHPALVEILAAQLPLEQRQQRSPTANRSATPRLWSAS